MIISVTKIRRRWQCRFGRHQWELVIDNRFGEEHRWRHCFSCGKERDRC